jgi:hypothetical protein
MRRIDITDILIWGGIAVMIIWAICKMAGWI